MYDQRLHYIVQICSSLVSLVGSLLIILMISCSPGKLLSTCYSRIITGLSFGEVLQSLAMLSGPFFSSGGVSMWSLGTVQSCNVNGFFMAWGSTVVPMYLLLLSMYYYYKINKKMSDCSFRKRFETKGHVLINLFAGTVCILALVSKTINPLPGAGSVCHFARYPTDCSYFGNATTEYSENIDNSGNISYTHNYNNSRGLDDTSSNTEECTRGKYATLFGIITPTGCTFVSFVGITVYMALLCHHSIFIEKLFKIDDDISHTGATANNPQNKSCGGCLSCICFNKEHYRQRENESRANYLLRISRRETVVQSILYVSSFLLNSMAIFITFISTIFNADISPWIRLIFVNGLYPLLGFFNILVYCGPKITLFRMMHPHVSWFRSFSLVVKAGGEVPCNDRFWNTDGEGCCNRSGGGCFCCCFYPGLHFDGVSSLSSSNVDNSSIILQRIQGRIRGGEGGQEGGGEGTMLQQQRLHEGGEDVAIRVLNNNETDTATLTASRNTKALESPEIQQHSEVKKLDDEYNVLHH